MKKPTCRAVLVVDTVPAKGPQTVAFCELPEGHKGYHKGTRVARKDLFVTIKWDKDCHNANA